MIDCDLTSYVVNIETETTQQQHVVAIALFSFWGDTEIVLKFYLVSTATVGSKRKTKLNKCIPRHLHHRAYLDIYWWPLLPVPPDIFYQCRLTSSTSAAWHLLPVLPEIFYQYCLRSSTSTAWDLLPVLPEILHTMVHYRLGHWMNMLIMTSSAAFLQNN